MRVHITNITWGQANPNGNYIEVYAPGAPTEATLQIDKVDDDLIIESLEALVENEYYPLAWEQSP